MISTQALIKKFQEALDDHWGYIWGTAGELWTEADQKQLEKTTDSDRAQGRQYGSKWIGHHVADCSGLFYWAFKKLGGDMYHGSNTMYLKWCVDKGELKKGKRTDGKKLKPGTAVFVWNGSTYSHVGLFIGNDQVIEAANTIKGVITNKVTATKWSHWGELKGVSFDAQTAEDGQPQKTDPEDAALPTLRRGDKGKYVKQLQQLLLDRGYKLPKYGADGDFGAETEAAVKQFQRDWGLKVDGIAGPETNKMLQSTPAKAVTYTVEIPGLDLKTAQKICAEYKHARMEEEKG